MSFLLIMLNAHGMTSHELPDEASCNAAGEAFVEAVKGGKNWYAGYHCIPLKRAN